MERPLRILLIDDDRDDQVLVRELLSDALDSRFTLITANSYAEGLSLLQSTPCDVGLLDYRLGSQTGLDLLRQAAALKIDVPLILLTGNGEREIDLAAMQAGAADYLTKDRLLADTLERTLRHSVERHRDRQALRLLNEQLESRVQERTRELEEANLALREADRHKDEFLAILAHELRNPLAPLSNSLEILGLSSDNSELKAELLGTMRRQLAQLVRLVDDLLEVSRIGRGKIQLRASRMELAPAARQAWEAAQPFFQAKRHDAVLTITPTPLWLVADPARMAQIIGNLLNNAAKFTDPGGRIELIVETNGSEAIVRVRDSGLGIAPEHLQYIFRPFAQVDASLERNETGLGIGLTLVRDLVEMQGGTVHVASDGLGLGAEFTVRLPLAPTTEAPTTTNPGANQAAPLPRHRVLVVDDNRDSVYTLERLLKLQGQEVHTAFDGLAAVELAERERPNVILLDIGLPRLNGYEAARAIRQASTAQQPVLIAMTGWGQHEDRRKSAEAGFNHHLVKPLRPAELIDILRRLPRDGGS